MIPIIFLLPKNYWYSAILILSFGTVCLVVFIAAFMGGDFVSFLVYPTTIHEVHTILTFCSIICLDHFRSGDRLRANLGIICGQGIIYVPVQITKKNPAIFP